MKKYNNSKDTNKLNMYSETLKEYKGSILSLTNIYKMKDFIVQSTLRWNIFKWMNISIKWYKKKMDDISNILIN